jgi:hypothetical protein
MEGSMKTKLLALAVSFAALTAASGTALANSKSPVFGNANVQTLSVEENKAVKAKGYYADLYGYYGYLYSYYAYYYAYYGYAYSSASYYYYGYLYSSYATSYLYYAYVYQSNGQ